MSQALHMVSASSIVKYLRNPDTYLGQFIDKKSTHFEHLIAAAFSRLFYLPFYTSDSDDKNIKHRVTWLGSDSGGRLSKAPGGGPDAIAYCYGFYLIIEATRKNGANQWSGEFAQAVRHCNDFVKASRVEPSEVYIVLVTPTLYEDTYLSLRHRPQPRYKFIPLECLCLAEILDTSILAFTMKHLEIRGLFNEVLGYVKNSSMLEDFRKGVKEGIEVWKKGVLKLEKAAFIGVKSYEAMQEINRPAVAAGEILSTLLKYPFVERYLNIIGEDLTVDEIRRFLEEQSLGRYAGKTIKNDEPFFESVPCLDFKGRGLRLIGAVERIGH